MKLAKLIETHKSGRSYNDLARDCGGVPTGKRLQQLATAAIREFPDPPTLRALAKGLKVSQTVVIMACAESLELDVARPQGKLLELLPASTEDLTDAQAEALAQLVRSIVMPAAAPGDVRRSLPSFAEAQALRQGTVVQKGQPARAAAYEGEDPDEKKRKK